MVWYGGGGTLEMSAKVDLCFGLAQFTDDNIMQCIVLSPSEAHNMNEVFEFLTQ